MEKDLNKLIFIILTLLLISCNSETKLVIVEGETMGTYYRVTTYSAGDKAGLKVDIDKFLMLFNNIFSTYIPTSEISKINNNKYAEVGVTDTMKKLLELSQDISRKSKGYFDITVAPIVNAWGFGPAGKVLKRPSEEVLTELKKNIGYYKLKFKEKILYRESKAVQLDMSGIAKGFGVDELVKFLEYQGYGDLLVDIGGEVRSRGKKTDGSLWRIGIEGPTETLGSSISKVVELDNMALATSGNYRNYVKFGDTIFGHTIDPLTGKPAKHRTVSVSVLSEFCADADAWATALMAMGSDKGLDLANKYNLLVYFQVQKNAKLEVLTSRAFDKYVNKKKGL